jgi:hypothetical protein
MDILGENKRESMRLLPREKKLLLIKQITVRHKHQQVGSQGLFA